MRFAAHERKQEMLGIRFKGCKKSPAPSAIGRIQEAWKLVFSLKGLCDRFTGTASVAVSVRLCIGAKFE